MNRTALKEKSETQRAEERRLQAEKTDRLQQADEEAHKLCTGMGKRLCSTVTPGHTGL